jgi:hypothetical protein
MLQRQWRKEFDARNADFVIERAAEGFSLVLIHIASPMRLALTAQGRMLQYDARVRE